MIRDNAKIEMCLKDYDKVDVQCYRDGLANVQLRSRYGNECISDEDEQTAMVWQYREKMRMSERNVLYFEQRRQNDSTQAQEDKMRC